MENNNPNLSPDYQTILDNYAKAVTAQPQPVSPPPQTPVTPVESPAEAPTPPTLETGFESQLESGLTSLTTPPPSKKIDFIKIIFYLSLVSFLLVCLYGVYSFLQNPNGQSFFSSPTPTVPPVSTPTPITSCTLNDQKYAINTSFPATDGCNTCTCAPDLQISCTTVTCDVTPPASTSSAIPSDWKILSSSQFSFSLKYPPSWQYYLNANNELLKLPAVKALSENNETITNSKGCAIHFGFGGSSGPSDTMEETDTTIGGQKFTKRTWLDNKQPTFISYLHTTPPNNKFEVLLAWVPNNNQKVCTQEIDQILSTFKFLENNEKQLSYVTINYPKYNLSFRMPRGWYFSNDAMNGNYKPIDSDVTIDSYLNMLYFTDNLNSKLHLTIGLDPNKPKEYSVDKQGNSPEFDKIISSLKFTSTSQSLIPANSTSPASGICSSESDQTVIITINDDTPDPRCVKVTSNQKLSIINKSKNSISINLSDTIKTTILPGKTYLFSQAVGLFLAPGVHSIAGAEIWLQ